MGWLWILNNRHSPQYSALTFIKTEGLLYTSLKIEWYINSTPEKKKKTPPPPQNVQIDIWKKWRFITIECGLG